MIRFRWKKQWRKEQGINNVRGANSRINKRVPNVFYIVIKDVMSAYKSGALDELYKFRYGGIMEVAPILLNTSDIQNLMAFRLDLRVNKCNGIPFMSYFSHQYLYFCFILEIVRFGYIIVF